MKALRAVLFVAAALTALMPGIVTWVMLCSESRPRDECVSRLSRLQLSLTFGDESTISAQRRAASITHLSDLESVNTPTDTLTGNSHAANLSFAPGRIVGNRDMLVAVVSDWRTFTGALGTASREWARYLSSLKKHTISVIYFVGQCPGLTPGALSGQDCGYSSCLPLLPLSGQATFPFLFLFCLPSSA
jgi:hypothetical protein